MEIIDISVKYIPTRNNPPLLPKNLRGLMVGNSNCGKTTLLLNLLQKPNWLDYNNLMVFGNSLFQTEYQIMKEAFEKGLRLIKSQVMNIFDNQVEQFSPLDMIKGV